MKGNGNVSWGKGKTWAFYKCAREETKGFIVWICISPGPLFPSLPSPKWYMIMFLGKLGSVTKPHPHHTYWHLKQWWFTFLPAFYFLFFFPLSLPPFFYSHPPSCCSKCLQSCFFISGGSLLSLGVHFQYHQRYSELQLCLTSQSFQPMRMNYSWTQYKWRNYGTDRSRYRCLQDPKGQRDSF